MGFFDTIFLKIANRFGFEMQKKKESKSDYKNTDDISLTAVMANRLATQVVYGSRILVKGENQRAEFIKNIAAKFDKTQMATATEVSLGSGGAIVKPYTDGERIGIDIIDNDNIRICESIGDFIKSCVIIADKFEDDYGNTYVRAECQTLKNIISENNQEIPTLIIYQMAFKNNKEIPLKTVKAWEDIKPEIIIPNVDRLLFGYYKCPTVNRDNVNSPKGVSITYGAQKVMEKAVSAFYRYNDEFERKEAYIFADKTALQVKRYKTIEDGSEKIKDKVTIPNGKDHIFIDMRQSEDGKLPLEFYSPEIRGDVMKDCVDFDLRIVELICGFSAGILTPPNSNNATATEIDALKEQTYAFVDRTRDAVEHGTKDLMYAIDVLCNLNNITPIGEWELTFEWSNELRENLEKKFQRLSYLESIGAYGKDELRVFETKEDIQTAQEKVQEISETFVQEI